MLIALISLFLSASRSVADIETLKSKLQEDPDDLKVRYQLAVELSKSQEHESAIEHWRELHRERPSDPKIGYLFARELLLFGEAVQAVAQCSSIRSGEWAAKCKALKSKAMEDYPEVETFLKANQLIGKKKMEEAQEIVEELLGENSENPYYRLLMGKIYHSQKKYDFAMDQYRYAEDRGVRSSKKWIGILKGVGKKAIAIVNKMKRNVEDEDVFYSRVYMAFKLAPEDADDEFGGFKSRAADYYKQNLSGNEDDFYYNYRMGYLQALLGYSGEAQQSINNALNNAPDDNLYAVADFNLIVLEKINKQRDAAVDLIAQVGGEDAYRMLQEAAMKASKAAGDAGAGKQVQDIQAKLGVSEAEFKAEFEKYKKKIEMAPTPAEKDRLIRELKSKYGNAFNDPGVRAHLSKMMKSDQGKEIANKYKDKLNKFR